MSQELYVVIETSTVGDEIIGVFASLAEARAVLPTNDVDRLIANFRVELHVLGETASEEAWRVSVSRDGRESSVERLILCSCEDDAAVLASTSFIEPGGENMRIVVWARCRGSALRAAEHHRRVLMESGAWQSAHVPLAPIVAQSL
jgi:hypothetical protein